ncbi:MAG: hypothetical protein ACE5I1_13710 [bacterium]
MPDVEQVHDPALTNVAIRYLLSSNLFIADQVLPITPVSKESDRYSTYTKKDWFSIPNAQIADGDAALEARFNITHTTYNCEEYGVKAKVTDRARNNQSDAINLEADTTEFVTQLTMLEREKRIADAVFNTTTFASYTAALSTANQWDNYTSSDSDPIDDVETAKQNVLLNTGMPANTLIIGYQVYRYVRNHPEIIGRVKEAVGGEVKNVNERMLAVAFDLDRVLVGRATYNSANPGQSESDAFIWGKFAMVAHIKPRIPSKGVTLGGTFRVGSLRMMRWRTSDPAATWVRPQIIEDEVITATAAGYLYSTVVS